MPFSTAKYLKFRTGMQKRIGALGLQRSPANITKAAIGSAASRFISRRIARLRNDERPFSRHDHARLFTARPSEFVLIPGEALLLPDPRRVAAKNLPNRSGCLEKC